MRSMAAVTPVLSARSDALERLEFGEDFSIKVSLLWSAAPRSRGIGRRQCWATAWQRRSGVVNVNDSAERGIRASDTGTSRFPGLRGHAL